MEHNNRTARRGIHCVYGYRILTLEKELQMKFNWRYALDKILIYLTSTKNLTILAGVLYSLLELELSPDVQVMIVAIATALASILKAWEDVNK